MGEVWAIVVAAGSGSRFGDAVPKQFLDLAGRRLVDWAVGAAAAVCDGVIAVLPPAQLGTAFDRPEAGAGAGRGAAVAGGGRPTGPPPAGGAARPPPPPARRVPL